MLQMMKLLLLSALFSQLRTIDNEQLFVEFNVGLARQTCLSSEVRIQLEHEHRGRKTFEGKCAMQADWLKQRDAKIASLKAQLSLKEAEAAKMSCDELSVKAASLESEKYKLAEQVSTLEASYSGLHDEVSGLDSELMKMALHMDEEFYPRYLTTIPAQRAIGRAIDKGPAAQTPEASQLQPTPEQLMLLIHRLEDQVVIGETFLSFSLDVDHARVQRIRGDTAF
nr:hypothetical protein [Tanacetum cinerariifolium]